MTTCYQTFDLPEVVEGEPTLNLGHLARIGRWRPRPPWTSGLAPEAINFGPLE